MSSLAVILTFWFVTFCDKGGSKQLALGAEALALRAEHGIAIDSLDYAVSTVYVDSLRKKGARICHTSRWMNGATIEASQESANAINGLPFVKSIEATKLTEGGKSCSVRKLALETKEDIKPDYREQLELFNLHRLHEKGYKGQGITIGVLDVGFRNLLTLTAFDSIRKNGQLLGVYDFADEVTDIYGEGSEHGATCLGLIAGNRADYQGAANQAKFYVMRTEEYSTESPKEPDNWIAAVEKCDSLGVWIVSTSLGYQTFDNPAWNYTQQQMDGKTCRASRAATIAARKGLLLCTAAGNSAAKATPWIGVPGDADSTLTVGAVGRDSVWAYFSSLGPTADGRIKPDVMALGLGSTLINPANEELRTGNGTSLATPLLAGFAACLWSAFPTETNMQIRERIIQSAHRVATPDGNYGYGIPDAWKAYQLGTDIQEQGRVRVESAQKVLKNGQVIIERNGERYSIMGQKL